MTEKKGRRALYIIFSIAVSIALWTYVVYVENPVLDQPVAVSDIPIEFMGEELLRDNNLIVSNVDVRSLTVYFGGRLRDKARISALEVRAVVDLTDVLRSVSPAGTHALKPDLIYEDSGINKLTVDSVSAPVVEVTVEQLVTKNIDIRAVFNGSTADGYMAGALSLSRDTVTVAGTEAAVERIFGATATLTADDLSQTINREVSVTLLDDTGAEIDPTEAGITFINGTGTVFLTQNVLMVKEVPFKIDIVETPSVNDANIGIFYSSDTIRIAGDPEVLDGYNSVNLGTVDLKSFNTSYEGEYQVTLPDGTRNLSGITTVTVTINIMDSNIEIRRLSTANIAYRNAGDGDTVEILNETIPVVIRGASELIAEVSEENVRIVADLSGVAGSKGTFEVPARVYVDGFPQVDAVGEYKVNVFIS